MSEVNIKFKVGDMVELTCSGGYNNYNAGDIVEAVEVSSGGFFVKRGLFFANNEGQLHQRKVPTHGLNHLGSEFDENEFAERESEFWSIKADELEEERVLDELALSRYTLDELKIELARREELKEARYTFTDADDDIFKARVTGRGKSGTLNLSCNDEEDLMFHLTDIPRLVQILENAHEDFQC